MKFAFSNITKVIDLITELALGLTSLSFEDNFKSFIEEDITIRAGQITRINNRLKAVPSKYIIVNHLGASIVTRSDVNKWTDKALYLKNTGENDVTISVLFVE